MSFRLLIDECLSPELVELAVAAGHVESTCARDRGLLGLKDWELIRVVIERDYTFVTCNAQDFRGLGPDGLGGYHAAEDVHAGLVCLNSALPLDLDRQRALFQVALEELAGIPDLVNRALEVFEDTDGSIKVVEYDIPLVPH